VAHIGIGLISTAVSGEFGEDRNRRVFGMPKNGGIEKWYHQKVLFKSFPMIMVMSVGFDNLNFGGQFLCPALGDRGHLELRQWQL
jgi:hypothetical protein